MNFLSSRGLVSMFLIAGGTVAACSSSGEGGGSSAGSGATGGSGASTSQGGSATAGSSSGGAASGGVASGGAASGGSSAGGSSQGGFGGAGGSPFTNPEPGVKIAFFGDQGLTTESRQVLAMIVAEGADFVIHLGDFDYDDDPPAWDQLMTEGLGDLPWFAVVGNHDDGDSVWPAYQKIIEDKLATISDVDCIGEAGVKQACTYKGVRMVLSGVGLLGSGHESFVRGELTASDHIWRICAWHLNQSDMQLGSKSNGTGWGVHRACQDEGAMIINGHEHSYARTYTMTDLGNEPAGHGKTGVFDLMQLRQGSTYVTVNGIGGAGIRVYNDAYHDDDTWWASGYASDMNIRDNVRTPVGLENLMDKAAAAFIELGVDGNPAKGRGYMKTVDGRIMDQWDIDVDPTGFGTGTSGSGGAGGTGSGVCEGWGQPFCDTFCQKCADCDAAGNFDEGDCQYGGGAGFSDCMVGCCAGVTPSQTAYDGLTTGWESWTCSELDGAI